MYILTAKQGIAKGSESFPSLDLSKSLSVFLMSFGLFLREGLFRGMCVNWMSFFLLYVFFLNILLQFWISTKEMVQALSRGIMWMKAMCICCLVQGRYSHVLTSCFLPSATAKGEMGPKGQSGVPGHRGPIGRPGKRGKQVGPRCFLFLWLMASVWLCGLSSCTMHCVTQRVDRSPVTGMHRLHRSYTQL